LFSILVDLTLFEMILFDNSTVSCDRCFDWRGLCSWKSW